VDLNKLSRTLSEDKRDCMPLSFTNFGSMAIIGMVLILSAAQGIQYLKSRHRHH
jgi:hypothetical protein